MIAPAGTAGQHVRDKSDHDGLGRPGRFGGNVGFYDLKTLRPTDLGKPAPGGGLSGHGLHSFGEGHQRVSADGTVFGGWRANVSPQGLTIVTRVGGDLRLHYDHTSVGHVIPGSATPAPEAA